MAVTATEFIRGLDGQGRRQWGFQLANTSDVLTTDGVTMLLNGYPQAVFVSYLDITLTSVGVGAASTIAPQFQRSGEAGAPVASTDSSYLGAVAVPAAHVIVTTPLGIANLAEGADSTGPTTKVILKIVPDASGGGNPNNITGCVVFTEGCGS